MSFLRLYILSVLALVTSYSFAQESILLRNKFVEGKEVFFKAALGSEGVTRSGGSENEVSNTMHVLFGFQTETITDSGKANLTMRIHQMDIENPIQTTGTKPDMKKILGLSDAPMRMTLDTLGRVVHAPALGSKANSNQPELTEQTPWLHCPEKEIKVGESWQQQRTVPLTGASKPVIAYTTYTLDSITEKDGKSIAVIKTLTDINEKDVVVDPFANQPAGGATLVFKITYKNYNFRGTGTIHFDLNEGHIMAKDEEGTMVQDIESDLSMDGAEFPSSIVHAFQLTTKAEYSDTKPEAANPETANPESTEQSGE